MQIWLIVYHIYFFDISFQKIDRNRVALLQKEEERARKKIDQTKERAMEIIAMRDENERRLQSYIEMSNE